jgi:hypothetical protein
LDGNFKDPESETIPEGQAAINFLLRGCYRIMAKMLSENVPVAEALMPVHNQLSTVRRCLIEVTKWGKPDSGKYYISISVYIYILHNVNLLMVL